MSVDVHGVLYERLAAKLTHEPMNIRLLYSVDKYTSIVNVGVVAVTSDPVDVDARYADMQSMKDVREKYGVREDETVIAFCLYLIESAFIRNTRLCVEIYLSRLWSYVPGIGAGVLVMYVGYALAKYKLNTDREFRNNVLSKDFLTNVYYTIRDGNIDGGLYYDKTKGIGYGNARMTHDQFVKHIHNATFDLCIALTFHDESTEFMAGSSFYKFLVKDKIGLRRGVYEGIISKTYRNGPSSYSIKPVMGHKSAYAIFNEGRVEYEGTESGIEAAVRALRRDMRASVEQIVSNKIAYLCSLYGQTKSVYLKKK